MTDERRPDQHGQTQREKYREYLVSTKQKSQQAHDDGILKVCGGALGVSFAFVNSFVEGPPLGRWLLMLAWVSWGLALAVVILSHRHSTLAADAAIAKHDAQGAQIAASDRTGPGPEDSRSNRIVRTLNRYGWFLFVLGMTSLGAFIYLNMGGVSNGSEQQHEEQHYEDQCEAR